MIRCLLSLAFVIGSPAVTLAGERSENPNLVTEASFDTDHWLLLDSLQGTLLGGFLGRHQIQVYGWTEVSFTASTAAHQQLPMGFNYRANEFLLQQNWLRLERTVNSDDACPSFGFLADTILPGSDYRFTLARGLLDEQDDTYGFDPVQFYAQGYFPCLGSGLDLKVGRFFGQYGVESIDSIQTPFVSRAYTFIYNPFTHTGMLATLNLNDNWSVQNALVTGSDVFFDSAANPTYIGRLTWAPPESQYNLALAMILGSGSYDTAENFQNPQVFDLVYNHKISDDLTFTFNSLFGYQTGVPGIGTATWFGVVNYLSYQLTPQLSPKMRLEFFDDIDGNRTGFPGLYTAITTGLSFQPRKHLLIRPELRYDYNNESRPFEDKHGLFTATADFILRW